jgi:hypothetical protein
MISVAFLFGRAGCLTALFGGFRPGQYFEARWDLFARVAEMRGCRLSRVAFSRAAALVGHAPSAAEADAAFAAMATGFGAHSSWSGPARAVKRP